MREALPKKKEVGVGSKREKAKETEKSWVR